MRRDNPLRFDHPLFDMFERFFHDTKINAKITILSGFQQSFIIGESKIEHHDVPCGT